MIEKTTRDLKTGSRVRWPIGLNKKLSRSGFQIRKSFWFGNGNLIDQTSRVFAHLRSGEPVECVQIWRIIPKRQRSFKRAQAPNLRKDEGSDPVSVFDRF